MKLILTVHEFFDKVENKYINDVDSPIIEREDERGMQLIKAGVCEEYVEPKKPRKKKTEETDI